MILSALLVSLACRTPLPSPVGWGASGLDARPSNLTCLAPERPAPLNAAVRLEDAFPNLQWGPPVQMLRASEDAWFVALQTGHVHRFADDPATTLGQVTTPMIIPATVGGERGLVGFTVHPRFAENGYAYANLTRTLDDGKLHTLITRYQSVDGGLSFDLATERVLLDVIQPADNHNGGQILFGPDGFLYIALGDGGGGNDVFRQAQDLDSVLGKILRIDVDGPFPYAIPRDNPFAQGGGRPEIFAWGLRNPWRFSFDRLTGEIWAGDVGQDAFEEISQVPLGGNLGWPMKEGFNCRLPEGCDDLDLIDPVVVYPHEPGQRSVTGGFVYRGTAMPELAGTYLYADFYVGELRGVRRNAEGAWEDRALGAQAGMLVSSFVEDTDGELLVLGYGPGRIKRVVAADPEPPPDTFPRLLSQTGCVAEDPWEPAAGLVPYAPVAPFWSDGAEKGRWVALPDGASATLTEAGHVDLPVGSVLLKRFAVQGLPTETRLLVRHADGGWGAYTYAWDQELGDARLLEGGATIEVEGQTWEYPDRAACFSCHTAAAGTSLGLEAAQLHAPFAYPGGGTGDQLHTWVTIGLLDAALPANPAEVPALVDPFGEAPLDARARAWLHTNCASCHRPESGNRTPLDLRFDTPLRDTAACDERPELDDLGLTDARLIAPGAPERSVLLSRLARRDAAAMPPLASRLPDPEGVELITAWIAGLERCRE